MGTGIVGNFAKMATIKASEFFVTGKVPKMVFSYGMPGFSNAAAIGGIALQEIWENNKN